MSYSVGSLVRARSREWVVLPESKDDFLILRPLGGTDDEITGISDIVKYLFSWSNVAVVPALRADTIAAAGFK